MVNRSVQNLYLFYVYIIYVILFYNSLHLCIDPLKCSCTSCGKVDERTRQIKKHIQNVHVNIEMLTSLTLEE